MILFKTNLNELPETCRDCNLKVIIRGSGSINGIHFEMLNRHKPDVNKVLCIGGMDVHENAIYNTKHGNCPLVEVPTKQMTAKERLYYSMQNVQFKYPKP